MAEQRTHAILQDDTKAAREELAASQYGQFANAEEMIRAHSEATSPTVAAALRRQVNVDAARTLDFSTIDVPEGGKLLDATVRGTMVSFVYETEDGDYRHGAIPYDPDQHSADDEVEASKSRAKSLVEVEEEHLKREASGEGQFGGTGVLQQAQQDAQRRAQEGEEPDTEPSGIPDQGAAATAAVERRQAGILPGSEEDSVALGSREGTEAPEVAKDENGWPQYLPNSHAKLDQLAEEKGVEFEDDASVAEKKAALEEAKAKEASS